VLAVGVEAPLEDVAVDDRRFRDKAIALALLLRADVDQEVTLLRGVPSVGRVRRSISAAASASSSSTVVKAASRSVLLPGCIKR